MKKGNTSRLWTVDLNVPTKTTWLFTKNPNKKWPHDTRLCEEQMCKGKHPYKIAQILYPNAYKNKEK